MKNTGKQKAIVLIMTLWIVVVLLIIGVAMADMSLSNLFYIGFYSQKQQAIDLADCGIKEVIGRIIGENLYGTSSEELPDSCSPDFYKDKLYYISFDQSGAGVPWWLSTVTFQYSYNNLGNGTAFTIPSTGKVIPPESIYIVSYAKSGNIIVRVDAIVSPDENSGGDPLTVGGADSVYLEADNDIDVSSADSSLPVIWSNLNISNSVTMDAKKINIHGGVAGSSNTTAPDYGVCVVQGQSINKDGGTTKIPPDVNIVSLDTDTTAPEIPSGTYILNGTEYDFYDDKGTPADPNDDVLTYKITGAGVCNTDGTPVADSILKNAMKSDGGTLSVERNIRIKGNMVLLKGDGIMIKNGAYIYLENYNSQTGSVDSTRWSDYYASLDPAKCIKGSNVIDSTVNDHPDKRDPVNPGVIPVSPYVDKPMYGNLSMFDGSLTGKGSIYSQGSVTINARDPIVLSAGKDGIAVVAKGDINVSSNKDIAKFNGLLYSHEDIMSNIIGKDLIITGSLITSGGSTYGDPSIAGKGKLHVKCKDFKLTYDPSYLKALQGAGGSGLSSDFIIKSWLAENI